MDLKHSRKLDQNLANWFKQPNCLLCGRLDASWAVGIYEQANSDLVMHHITLFSAGGAIKMGGRVATLCHDCHRAAHTSNGKFSWHHVNPEIAITLAERTKSYQEPIFTSLRTRHEIPA